MISKNSLKETLCTLCYKIKLPKRPWLFFNNISNLATLCLNGGKALDCPRQVMYWSLHQVLNRSLWAIVQHARINAIWLYHFPDYEHICLLQLMLLIWNIFQLSMECSPIKYLLYNSQNRMVEHTKPNQTNNKNWSAGTSVFLLHICLFRNNLKNHSQFLKEVYPQNSTIKIHEFSGQWQLAVFQTKPYLIHNPYGTSLEAELQREWECSPAALPQSTQGIMCKLHCSTCAWGTVLLSFISISWMEFLSFYLSFISDSLFMAFEPVTSALNLLNLKSYMISLYNNTREKSIGRMGCLSPVLLLPSSETPDFIDIYIYI